MVKGKNIDSIDSSIDKQLYGDNMKEVKAINKENNDGLKTEISKMLRALNNNSESSENANTNEGDIVEILIAAQNIAKKIDAKGMINQLEKKKAENKMAGIDSMSMFTQLMDSEKNRIIRYSNYDILHSMITQVAEALNTFVENIISPDDFTKNSLTVNLNTADSDERSEFERNMKILTELYNIDEKTITKIRESLKSGDGFTYIDRLSDLMSSALLNESTDMGIDILGKVSLDKLSILAEEEQALKELVGDSVGEKDVQTLMEEFKTDVKNFVNDQVIFTTETRYLNEELCQLNSDFASLCEDASNPYTRKDSFVQNDIDDETFKKGSKNDKFSSSNKKEIKTPASDTFNYENKTVKNIAEVDLDSKAINKAFNYKTSAKQQNNDVDLSHIKGCVVKTLKPERTIKLWSDGFTYGYLYVETVSSSYLDIAQKSNVSSSSMFNNIFASANQAGLIKNKQEYMYDYMFRNITGKLNKDFISNNPQFKYVIHNILQQKDLYKKKIRIIFIPASKVVHWTPGTDDTEEYGKSLYEDILFTAKIYLSTLMSMLMMMLVRGADKRAWYVNIGEDAETEAVIQSVINDVKGREIKLNDFGDIQHVLKLVGMFDDYFFPTINGDKPLDMEIIEGQKQDLASNDFLEYLRKAMIAGLGISPAHIGYTEDLELAKTLTMLNGKFIRKTINYQKAYKIKASKFIRLLYKMHFLNDENKDNFDVSRIEVNFPSPATLNFNNLNDLLGNSDQIIGKIAETMVAPDDNGTLPNGVTPDVLKFEFTKALMKKMLPMIEWDEYETLLADVTKNIIKKYSGSLAGSASALDDGTGGDPDAMDDGSGGGDFGAPDDTAQPDNSQPADKTEDDNLGKADLDNKAADEKDNMKNEPEVQ